MLYVLDNDDKYPVFLNGATSDLFVTFHHFMMNKQNAILTKKNADRKLCPNDVKYNHPKFPENWYN